MFVESILLEEIRSSDRMVRLFALEQVIQEGQGERLLGELQARVSTETDDECRVMLGHAVNALQRRISGGPARVAFENSSGFEDTLFLADFAGKIGILTSLSESQIGRAHV